MDDSFHHNLSLLKEYEDFFRDRWKRLLEKIKEKYPSFPGKEVIQKYSHEKNISEALEILFRYERALYPLFYIEAIKEEMEHNNVLFDKVALLIANQNYHNDKLEQPIDDVKKIAEKLKAMNFRVMAFKDLVKKEMEKVISLFCKELSPGVYGVVYYAGHGFSSITGKMYLLPLDASKPHPQYSISIEKILSQMQKESPELSAIFVDACRSLPLFRPTQICTSLQAFTFCTHFIEEDPIISMKGNVFIGFSTSPNEKSYEIPNDSGLFAKYLKNYIDKDYSLYEIMDKVKENLEKYEKYLPGEQLPFLKSNASINIKLNDQIRNDYLSHIIKTNWIKRVVFDEQILKCESDIEFHFQFKYEDDLFLNCLLIDAKCINTTFEERPPIFNFSPLIEKHSPYHYIFYFKDLILSHQNIIILKVLKAKDDFIEMKINYPKFLFNPSN